MAENDQKDKTVEKVTGEVENTDKKENVHLAPYFLNHTLFHQ